MVRGYVLTFFHISSDSSITSISYTLFTPELKHVLKFFFCQTRFKFVFYVEAI